MYRTTYNRISSAIAILFIYPLYILCLEPIWFFPAHRCEISPLLCNTDANIPPNAVPVKVERQTRWSEAVYWLLLLPLAGVAFICLLAAILAQCVEWCLRRRRRRAEEIEDALWELNFGGGGDGDAVTGSGTVVVDVGVDQREKSLLVASGEEVEMQ